MVGSMRSVIMKVYGALFGVAYGHIFLNLPAYDKGSGSA